MTALMIVAYVAGVGDALAFFVSRHRVTAVVAVAGFAAMIGIAAMSGVNMLNFGILLVVSALCLGGMLWLIRPRQVGDE